MSKKILIAEDEDVMRSMLVDYLEDFGFEVVEASHGEMAWEMWNTHKCDLLISDINMPHLNGIDLLKRIKEIDSSFPVIIITGVTVEIAKNEIHKHGADVFLTKPFKMKTLFEEIDKIFSKEVK